MTGGVHGEREPIKASRGGAPAPSEIQRQSPWGQGTKLPEAGSILALEYPT